MYWWFNNKINRKDETKSVDNSNCLAFNFQYGT